MNLDTLDIKDLLEGYRKREFSPSEVAGAYLKVIEASNPTLNAYLEVRPEETLNRARELEKDKDAAKLPLYGVPIAIKDNFLVKGWKATAGSRILGGYVAPYTAASVERLLAAGALVIGKTNLDEFAMGSSTENSAYGAVRNPWDTERVPGGSSGGSAVAVAGGMCAGSLGTDTGGSIRQPASLCGVVGLKPSYGRVSRYGIVAFASSLDQVGPFAHSTWDAARLFEAMAGYGGRDSTVSRTVVPQFTEELPKTSLKGLKIGIPWDQLEGLAPDVRAAFDSALEVYKQEGALLVDVALPHAKYAVSTYYLIAPSEASSNLARYDGVHYGVRDSEVKNSGDLYRHTRGRGFGPEVKLRIMLGTYALSAGYYDAYYTKANQVRRLIQQDYETAFGKCDVVATPTSPTTAFKLGEKTSDPLTMYLSDIFTIPANLAGLPGISIPCGLGTSGLPVGLQFVGRSFDEGTLFRAGHGFEKVRGPFQRAGKGGR